jgi:hypothetical protein
MPEADLDVNSRILKKGTDFPESSSADKLRIPTLEGSAKTQVDIKESMAHSTAPIGSDRAQADIITRTRAAEHGERVIGLNDTTAAFLEVLLFDIVKRLLGMGSCIVETLGNLLRLSYIYWETGKMKVERTLVLDVGRSVVYTLILVAIPFALETVVRVIAILWLYMFLALAFVLLVLI